MAKFEVTSPDGKRFEIEAPDGATNEQVMEFAKSQWAQSPAKPKPADPSLADRVLASKPGRFMKGMNSVVEGAAEVVPHALGVVSSVGGLNPNPVSDTLFGLSRRARQYNKDMESVYEGAKERTGVEGTDFMRLGGNLTASTAMGLAGPAAPVTTTGRAAFGAGMGGLAGGFTPTMEPDDQKFADKKAGQVTLGALAGGVATPLIGKATDKAGPLMDSLINKFKPAQNVSQTQIVERVRSQLAAEDINLADYPADIQQRMVSEVANAFKQNKKLDGAALLRKFDMDNFGGGTQGQITRDPGQWREEFNLRNVKGIGEPLLDQITHIRQETGRRLNEYGAASAATPYAGGKTAMESLLNTHKPVAKAVDDLYAGARNANGRYAEMDQEQFLTGAREALARSQTDWVLPSKIQGWLQKIEAGEVPFNVDTAAKLQKVISNASGKAMAGGQKDAALAARTVQNALDNTDLVEGSDPLARMAFNQARKMAKANFQTMDDVPALKAALEKSVPPEDFLDKFVIRGSIDELRNLTEIMPAPGQQAMRAHVAKYLEHAAFRSNVTKDGDMAVGTYNNALNELGKEKLSLIFPKDIVDDLYRIGRVNAYATVQPAGVVAARSGTAQQLMNNVFSRIKGMSLALPVVKGFADTGRLNRALSPAVPVEEIPVLTPALQRLLPAVPLGAGLGSE